MKNTFSSTEIAQAAGLTDRAIRKRADSEKWPYEVIKGGSGRGGIQKVYSLSSLPEDIRLTVSIASCRDLVKVPGADLPIDERQLYTTLARADLLKAYFEYARRASRSGKLLEAKKHFVASYNLGPFGTFPEIFRLIGPTSFQSIERWSKEVENGNGDVLALADQRGRHRKGVHALTDQQLKILLNTALNPAQPTKSEIIRIARARMENEGAPCLLKDRQLRNLLIEDEQRRYNIWVGAREGEKAHNEKCIYHVQRDWNRVEVGDILVADGHVLNFEILDPHTGRPKRMTLLGWFDGRSRMILGWEIMPTENVACISAALRRALIALGKWPLTGSTAYLDNGRAFRAKFFNDVTDFRYAQIVGLYERLGMQTIFAWPYHAESKPIEAFFGIFAECEHKFLGSFTGTSIEKKPPHLKRGERVHKLLHEKFFRGYKPDLYEAHEIIAEFFDEYAYRKVSSGHMKGKRPIDVFNEGKGPGLTPEQESELRYMMLPLNVRQVKRDGIELPGRKGYFYYHPALFGRRHPVLVRHDWHPGSSILVFETDGRFICEASLMPHVHPAAKVSGSDEEKEELKRQIELKRSQEKQTFGVARSLLKNEILPDLQRELEARGIEKKIEEDKSKPGKELVLQQVSKPQELTAEEREAISREVQERMLAQSERDDEAWMPEIKEVDLEEIHGLDVWDVLTQLDEVSRYVELLRLETKKVLIPSTFLHFMRYWERSPDYEIRKEALERLQLKWVIEYSHKRSEMPADHNHQK